MYCCTGADANKPAPVILLDPTQNDHFQSYFVKILGQQPITYQVSYSVLPWMFF